MNFANKAIIFLLFLSSFLLAGCRTKYLDRDYSNIKILHVQDEDAEYLLIKGFSMHSALGAYNITSNINKEKDSINILVQLGLYKNGNYKTWLKLDKNIKTLTMGPKKEIIWKRYNK